MYHEKPLMRRSEVLQATPFLYAAAFYAEGQFVIESKDAARTYRRYCFGSGRRSASDLFPKPRGEQTKYA